MKDLPKTKETILFDDRFLQDISNNKKTVTIRNSPVSLGYKKITENLTIEVLSCEKLDIMLIVDKIEHWGDDKRVVVKSPEDVMFCTIRPEVLGFKDNNEMYDYYEKYLKRDFAYAITLCICI